MNYASNHHLPAARLCALDRPAPGQPVIRRWRFVFLLLLILFCARVSVARPLSDYHRSVREAIASLDLLKEKEEGQSESALAAFSLGRAREALPPNEQVEWNGTSYLVNNSWLYADLLEFERKTESDPDRARVLDRILERLQGIEERLQEIEKQSAATSAGNADLKQRLATILQRSEYAGKPKAEPALGSIFQRFRRWLGRSLLRFFEWLSKLFPATAPGGRVSTVSRLTQVIIVGIAVAVIGYVLWLFAPRFFRHRKTNKKAKPEARIVLGERLGPDESAVDLLADAEALARAGDLRGAIRKGYIALLVELADRRVLSLAQHKTNRDYLRAVRELEPLHRNMEKLTNSFEVHWYGLVQASEHDWVDFRTGYRETLS